MNQFRILPVCVLIATISAAALADQMSDDPASRLGDAFVSRAAGISFRPPAGGAMVRRAAAGTDVVTFFNADENWSLKISRIFVQDSTPLLGVDDPKTPADESASHPGALDQLEQQFVTNNANARVLRKDLINVGALDVGLLVTRSFQGTQMWLRQQALIKESNRLYYLFDFKTPSGRTVADKDDVEDPAEAMAVGIFEAIIDTVRLIDQMPIIRDRDERIYRTLAWAVNLPNRIQKAVRSERYFRVMRDGKDVGWSFVTEELGQRRGDDGVFTAILSQGLSEPGTKIDMATEMFSTIDQRTFSEAWVTISIVEKKGQKETTSEFGQSRKRIRRVLQSDAPAPADPDDPGQPNVRMIPEHLMTVTQTTRMGPKPISRQVATGYYLPQALVPMLPRLVPLNEPKGFVFMTWVSAEGELVLRYVDVKPEEKVQFNGQTVRAAVVEERVGLEGDPTYHYITPEGEYLGSHSPATHLTVAACDAATIRQLYPNAQIARPHVLDTDNLPQAPQQ